VLGPVLGVPHVERPVTWLLDRGHEVIFVGNRSILNEPRTGYRFVRLPIAGLVRTLYSGLSEHIGEARAISLFSLICMPLLSIVHRLTRPDVVHVHWLDAVAYLCARSGLKPLIISVWGTDVNAQFLPDAAPGYRRILGEALGSASRIIVDTADMVEKCALLAGTNVATQLLPLGINTKRFRPGYKEQVSVWKQELDIPDDAVVLLSVRGFMPRYGHIAILEAFARALPQLDRPAILIFKFFNSSDRQLREEIDSRVARLDIARCVRWMEEIAYDQMPALYSMADIIVNYPEHDAFPVTFAEAAACERRVISCWLPAYKGTFAEKYFRMVPHNDAKALAEAIVDEVNQSANQEILSSARTHICQHFDEAATSRELIALYEEASGERTV
jgi:glycosyltransferase involved in cell wall biosynthesis